MREMVRYQQKIVGRSIYTALPYKLRRNLNLIYRNGEWAGVAPMIRELLQEAVDRRILQMNPKVSESLNSQSYQ